MTLTVQIDKSDPTITHTLSPRGEHRVRALAGEGDVGAPLVGAAVDAVVANGWNNADVTVTFTCDDQATLSGIASCTAPQTVTTEGTGQVVTGTAKDNAGNSATDPAAVNPDTTRPTITGSRAPAPNAAGWSNTDVTVHFDATDARSGVDSTTAGRTVGEGTGQSVPGTAVDAAGNSASTTIGGINVDETDPTLSGKPTTAANANGWYNGDVPIAWSVDDDRSGVGWLDGTLGDLTSEVRRAIGLAAGAGHHAVHAELCAYLRRAGVEVPRPSHRPGPWAATLAGRWQEAAAAWSTLGERYEHAVVLATAPDREARARGQRLLESLGAVATMAAT